MSKVVYDRSIIKKKGFYRKCKICKKDTYIYPCRKYTKTYCSIKCRRSDKKIIVCKFCKKKFITHLSSHRKYCSIKCSSIYKNKYLVGKKSSNWKGGSYIDKGGYKMVYRPNHPGCGFNNYIGEARLIVETQIGRYLTSKEVVHHLGKKNDNRPKKLMAFTSHSAHRRFEMGIHIVYPYEIIFDGRLL